MKRLVLSVLVTLESAEWAYSRQNKIEQRANLPVNRLGTGQLVYNKATEARYRQLMFSGQLVSASSFNAFNTGFSSPCGASCTAPGRLSSWMISSFVCPFSSVST